MTAKTANVIARVEPNVKAQAETIMNQLGIPVSVVINMLYKQIIITKGIPFTLTVDVTPMSLDEMDSKSFNLMMQRGLNDAKENHSRPVDDVFNDIERDFNGK